MDIDAKTREDDQGRATKDASPDRTGETKIQPEESENEQKKEGIEKGNEEDKDDLTDKDTEEGSEQNSNKDQHSDVSFREEADEEIDATDNEENWFEYIKRKHKRSWRVHGKTKNILLDWNTQKTNVANGTKNHFLASKKMEKKSLQLASWTGH